MWLASQIFTGIIQERQISPTKKEKKTKIESHYWAARLYTIPLLSFYRNRINSPAHLTSVYHVGRPAWLHHASDAAWQMLCYNGSWKQARWRWHVSRKKRRLITDSCCLSYFFEMNKSKKQTVILTETFNFLEGQWPSSWLCMFQLQCYTY